MTSLYVDLFHHSKIGGTNLIAVFKIKASEYALATAACSCAYITATSHVLESKKYSSLLHNMVEQIRVYTCHPSSRFPAEDVAPPIY